MMDYNIVCIHKPDRHNAHKHIEYVGVSGGQQFSQSQVISSIEEGKYRFYVDRGGSKTWVEVVISNYGHKAIRTHPDYNLSNNLLSLPECK
ncbi:hypothetical protein B488_09010 [Liberibacter crescens BT-1]|uniref:DUF3892 domain-containing protein n=1 Tax=Liberibacter crescens (strain BT-1) TaxID=1215343 RepID=L0EW49_LIBCB|nr:DUF3892 domain-containing protein [Liberibacter crescens]AGA64893.1 hypothetical protein B488_09010 [Liberibacter crescens BT-1]AMC12926.1 hypothetical protein RL73_04555 [Liberibacter crescens]